MLLHRPDSIHVDLEAIPHICKKYEELYGKELDGEELGQFNSDERMKMNISDLNEGDCTSHLMAMRCCEYEFKSDPGKTRYGTIAQNCLEHNVLKNLVKTDENDMYSVN
jgi:hypothetical protein